MVRKGLERSPFRNLIPLHEGCVVSYCPVASAVGTSVLHEGGNAVDANVATALALAVTYPQAGNLAGGAFMLIKPAREEAQLLDCRESAPRRASPELFAKADRSLRGGLAVAVPGTIAGLAEAVRRYGSWSWERLVRPAIELAEHGVWLTNRQAKYFELYHADLAQFPETARALLPEAGRRWRPGELFRNPDLGKTLRVLAKQGPGAFYEGALADAMVATIQRYGGVMEAQDLRDYKPVWRAPYKRHVFGRDVITVPLPSGGGIVILLALGLLEATGCAHLPVRSTPRYELLARAFRVAFAARTHFAGDPSVVPPEALARCEQLITEKLDPGALDRLERELGVIEPKVQGTYPGRNTTHLCSLDSSGMAVSTTTSLNTLFGSKLVADRTGVLLNNTIDDFGILPGVPNWYHLFEGRYNQLAPGLRPTGSMSPTLVADGDRVELVLGASGGPRIPTSIAQTILGVYGNGLALGQAAALPRVHHQFRPAELDVEDSIEMAQQLELERRGFDVAHFPRLGILAAIHRDTKSEALTALLDGRF